MPQLSTIALTLVVRGLPRAVARELEREALGEFLDELDEQLGPVPESELKRARRAWPKR